MSLECVQKAGFSREMVVKPLAFSTRSEPLTPLRFVRGSAYCCLRRLRLTLSFLDTLSVNSREYQSGSSRFPHRFGANHAVLASLGKMTSQQSQQSRKTAKQSSKERRDLRQDW